MVSGMAGLEPQHLPRLIKQRLEMEKAALVSQERVEPSGQFGCLMSEDCQRILSARTGKSASNLEAEI